MDKLKYNQGRLIIRTKTKRNIATAKRAPIKQETEYLNTQSEMARGMNTTRPITGVKGTTESGGGPTDNPIFHSTQAEDVLPSYRKLKYNQTASNFLTNKTIDKRNRITGKLSGGVWPLKAAFSINSDLPAIKTLPDFQSYSLAQTQKSHKATNEEISGAALSAQKSTKPKSYMDHDWNPNKKNKFQRDDYMIGLKDMNNSDEESFTEQLQAIEYNPN